MFLIFPNSKQIIRIKGNQPNSNSKYPKPGISLNHCNFLSKNNSCNWYLKFASLNIIFAAYK